MNKIKTTRNFLGTVIMVAALGLAACGGGSDGSSADTAGDAKSQAAAKVDSSCGRPNFDADALAIINAKRAAGAMCGAVAFPPAATLAWNSKIRNAATVHAQDMAMNGVRTHTGSDGSDAGVRMSRAGYAWSTWGENVGSGTYNLEQSLDAMMASPPHCAQTMDSKFKEVGIGCIDAFTAVNFGSK